MHPRVIRRSSAPSALAFALGIALWVTAAPAGAQHGMPPQDTHGAAARPPSAGSVEGHGAPGHAASGHADAAHATQGHAEHDEKAPPPEINWWHGVLGTKDGVEPGLLFRRPDEPPPFLANIFNFALLVFAFVYFGRKPLADALVKRKQEITREMSEAEELHKQARKRLEQYEAKLKGLGQELEHLRASFREQGLRDKERIVREAKERSDKMRADAAQMLEQELKHTRQMLLSETVEQATRLATQLIAEHGTTTDHDRFAESFLVQLGSRGRAGAVKGSVS